MPQPSSGPAAAAPSGVGCRGLQPSEVSNTADAGTIVRVQLPTAAASASVPAVAGDSLALKWGDQIIQVGTLTAADITAKYVDVTVPLSVLETQAFGIVPVLAQIVSAATGSTSNAAPLNVKWAYDLPTMDLTSLENGFAINGRAASEQLASNGYQQGSVNVGDVNGDGYDDMGFTNQAGNTHYVVYGKPGLSTVELSTLEVAGNSNGFILTGNGTGSHNTLAGDFNGDGLNDILVRYAGYSDYVVLGNTRSMGLVSPINTILGFYIGSSGQKMGGSDATQVGDFNGDGYSDFMLTGMNTSGNPATNYVVFGGSNLSAFNVNALSAAGNGKGYAISAMTATGVESYSALGQATGDVNGDGLDDIIFNDGSKISYVMFGKTGDAPVTLSAIQAGSGGFVIVGHTTASNTMDVDVVGDFNGDGLADMVVGHPNMTMNDKTTGGAYLVYGRTSGTSVTMTDLAASEGFRIDGGTVSVQMGMSSIERFNLTGTGTVLKLSALEVVGLSEKNNPFNTTTGWTASATGGPAKWGAVNTGAQVVVDGTTTSDLYLAGSWTNVGTVQNNGKTYKVLEDSTKAMAQVLVEASVRLFMPPQILASANELAGGLNASEANSSGGTPVAVNLADTGAVAGNTIQLNWGGQIVSYTLTAADIAAGTANVPVPTATLTAVTAMGTTGNVPASVTLLDGTTTVSAGEQQTIPVNFITATAPTICATTAVAANTRRALAHPLANTILATVLANESVNRCGPLMIRDLAAEHHVEEADVVKAWGLAWSALNLAPVFSALDANALDVPRDVSIMVDARTRALLKSVIDGVLSVPADQHCGVAMEELTGLFAQPDILKQLMPLNSSADDSQSLPAGFVQAWRSVDAIESVASFVFAAVAVQRPAGMGLAQLLKAGMALRRRTGIDTLERGLKLAPQSKSQEQLRNYAMQAVRRAQQRLLLQVLARSADSSGPADAIEAVSNEIGLADCVPAIELEHAILAAWAFSELGTSPACQAVGAPVG
eukprot:gene27222-33912_t